MNLDAYRIFTCDDGLFFVAAKKVGGNVKPIYTGESFREAESAIFRDMGYRIEPIVKDWGEEGDLPIEPEEWN